MREGGNGREGGRGGRRKEGKEGSSVREGEREGQRDNTVANLDTHTPHKTQKTASIVRCAHFSVSPIPDSSISSIEVYLHTLLYRVLMRTQPCTPLP